MAAKIKHGSTVAATVAVVALTTGWPSVRVINRGGGDLFVRADGVDPVVDADDVVVIPDGQSGVVTVAANVWGGQGSGAARPVTAEARLISSAVVKYSVVGTAG